MKSIFFDFICNDNWRMIRDDMLRAVWEDWGKVSLQCGFVFLSTIVCIFAVWAFYVWYTELKGKI